MARREITTGFVVEEGKISQGVVKVLVTVRQGRGADAVELCKDMPHYLDYSGVELDDLIDSAAANDVIGLQNSVWRSLSSSALKEEKDQTTKMVEVYNRERTRTAPDPQKALLNKIAKGEMKAEDLQSLIAELTKIAGGVK